MSDYTRIYNLTVKDSLPTGNSGKVIKGTELDAELNAVAAAISSKADTNSPTFTGTPAAPTAVAGTNTTQLATTAFIQAAIAAAKEALYPVGSVYINASSTTNPATLLGFGTWVTVGDGKVLVNQDTTDTSFDTMGETGGSKNAIVVDHNHTATSTSSSTSTVTDPGHTHTSNAIKSSGTDNSACGGGCYSGHAAAAIDSTTTGISVATTTTTTTTVANSGSSGTNANLQPYVVVKMWKRTA